MSNEIFNALANVNAGVSAIKKDKRNNAQKFNFRGIDDVMNELHSLFAKNGIIVVTEAQGEPILSEKEKVSVWNNEKKRSIIYFTRQLWKFTFYAKDGSNISSLVWGEAMDMGDKGMNKTISVSLKYALLTMFLIPTEDMVDSDSESHETTPKVEKPKAETYKEKKKSEQALYLEELKKMAPNFVVESQFTDEKAKIIEKFGFMNKEIAEYLQKIFNEKFSKEEKND